MRKIFHLEIKADNSHKYYGSLSALCSENPELGISKFTLDRFDLILQILKMQFVSSENQ